MTTCGDNKNRDTNNAEFNNGQFNNPESNNREPNNSESKRIVLTALSAVTPVGGDAKATAAAIRAGISAIKENPLYECLATNPSAVDALPFYAASVPLLDRQTAGVERVASLVVLALQGLQTQFAQLLNNCHDIGVLLALPAADASCLHWDINKKIENILRDKTPIADAKICRLAQLGHVGVFQLINEARVYLQTGQLDCCVVGGVDTWLDPQRLAALDQQGLLKSARNADGFIPGEAACVLVLETEAHARQHNHQILAQLGHMGEGWETNHTTSGLCSSGAGLANAISGATNGEHAIEFDGVYCDLNGESYRAFEWGLILSRLGAHFDAMSILVHPADCCGDVGAASGGLILLCAVAAVAAGRHADKPVLAWLASPGAERMALTLKRSPSSATRNAQQ